MAKTIMMTNSDGSTSEVDEITVNTIGRRQLMNQMILEHKINRVTMAPNQKHRVKLPNYGILAGLIVSVEATLTSTGAVTGSFHLDGKYLSDIFSLVQLSLADKTVRHRNSTGGDIQRIVDRYGVLQANAPAGKLQTGYADRTLAYPSGYKHVGGAGIFNTCFYVPCEIPIAGQYAGAIDMLETGGDNYIELETQKIDIFCQPNADTDIHKNCVIKSAGDLFDNAAINVDIVMLYRLPTPTLPIIDLRTVYSIDSQQSSLTNSNGSQRFELPADGSEYLSVVNFVTRNSYRDADMEDADNGFIQNTILQLGNQTIYDRSYKVARAMQWQGSGYQPVDLIIHDRRHYPISAINSGYAVIVNDLNLAGINDAIMHYTYERLQAKR